MKRKPTGNIEYRNIPHLFEKKSIKFFSLLFTGINAVAFGILSGKEPLIIILGVMFIILAPIAVIENRKELNTSARTVLTCILHLVTGVAFSLILSLWFSVAYFLEAAIIIFVIMVYRKKHNIKR